MRRRWIAAALLGAAALVAAAVRQQRHGSSDDGSATTGSSSARPARQGRRRRSASSSSARRTTSATTRPPTRAARPSPRRFPDLEVLTAENVPEDDNATRVMEAMIDKGAKIIFATSYGHLDPALKVAEAQPRRRRRAAGQLHQGRRSRPTSAPTSAPCTSRCTWPASPPGKATEIEQARLRLRLPDPADDRQHQRLPARRPVGEPRRRDHHVVNTSSWCDPAKQAEAAKSLLDQGVDVITQHQDCTDDHHQGRRGRRRRWSSATTPTPRARPQGLAHRLGVGLGRRCTSTS